MTAMSRQIFETAADSFQMQAELQVIGPDIFIAISGGDHPHIGTVTTRGKGGTQETIRFPSHSGRVHKDDVLADKVLEVIEPVLKGNCVLTAGVHVDHITQAQINASLKMARELGEQILAWLKSNPIQADMPTYYKASEQLE